MSPGGLHRACCCWVIGPAYGGWWAWWPDAQPKRHRIIHLLPPDYDTTIDRELPIEPYDPFNWFTTNTPLLDTEGLPWVLSELSDLGSPETSRFYLSHVYDPGTPEESWDASFVVQRTAQYLWVSGRLASVGQVPILAVSGEGETTISFYTHTGELIYTYSVSASDPGYYFSGGMVGYAGGDFAHFLVDIRTGAGLHRLKHIRFDSELSPHTLTAMSSLPTLGVWWATGTVTRQFATETLMFARASLLGGETAVTVYEWTLAGGWGSVTGTLPDRSSTYPMYMTHCNSIGSVLNYYDTSLSLWRSAVLRLSPPPVEWQVLYWPGLVSAGLGSAFDREDRAFRGGQGGGWNYVKHLLDGDPDWTQKNLIPSARQLGNFVAW